MILFAIKGYDIPTLASCLIEKNHFDLLSNTSKTYKIGDVQCLLTCIEFCLQPIDHSVLCINITQFSKATRINLGRYQNTWCDQRFCSPRYCAWLVQVPEMKRFACHCITSLRWNTTMLIEFLNVIAFNLVSTGGNLQKRSANPESGSRIGCENASI